MHNKQVNALVQATSDFAAKNGVNLSKEVEINAELLVSWIEFLTKYQLTGTADSLLIALRTSIRETAACLSLGLIRPALFSLRAQIDLILAWLYFKDHRIEWTHVNITGEGFKMKKELLEYLSIHNDRFKARLSLLKDIAVRGEPEPYRFLSAHIHGQSDVVLSSVNELKDLVRSPDDCSECAKAVYETSEYINDVLLSIYVSNWFSLPKNLCSAVEKRFVSPDQKREFFA